MKKGMGVLMIMLLTLGSCARRPMVHDRDGRRMERRPNRPAPPRDRPNSDVERRPNY